MGMIRGVSERAQIAQLSGGVQHKIQLESKKTRGIYRSVI